MELEIHRKGASPTLPGLVETLQLLLGTWTGIYRLCRQPFGRRPRDAL